MNRISCFHRPGWLLVGVMALGACDSTLSEQRFAVTLDYAGTRYLGVLSFPVDSSKSTVAHTEPATVESGDLPIESAESDLELLGMRQLPTPQISYQLLVKRNAADDAAFANAQPPEPFAICVLYEQDLGHATTCFATIENCSVTMAASE
jgi:hypothetical protein